MKIPGQWQAAPRGPGLGLGASSQLCPTVEVPKDVRVDNNHSQRDTDLSTKGQACRRGGFHKEGVDSEL